MKPKTEIKDVNEFLDQLVEEYVEVIVEKTKVIIENEEVEKYEVCAAIKAEIQMLSINVATTIADLSGVDYDLSIRRLEQNQKYIYENLRATFGE
jgi:hypothetical protein